MGVPIGQGESIANDVTLVVDSERLGPPKSVIGTDVLHGAAVP
jgi:hypothetical protein